MNRIAKFRRVSIVFNATDTGREFTVFLDEQRVRVISGSRESCTFKIWATEQVLWAILSGQMDADAAFFSGKVRIYGSIVRAFRVKNRFLSLLQKHLSGRLQDIEQLIEYH
jgi:putative sterol carrier protein